MGEAINLVENFKVEKVIFNCGAQRKIQDYKLSRDVCYLIVKTVS